MTNNLTDSLIKVLDNGGKEYAGAAKTETEDLYCTQYLGPTVSIG